MDTTMGKTREMYRFILPLLAAISCLIAILIDLNCFYKFDRLAGGQSRLDHLDWCMRTLSSQEANLANVSGPPQRCLRTVVASAADWLSGLQRTKRATVIAETQLREFSARSLWVATNLLMMAACVVLTVASCRVLRRDKLLSADNKSRVSGSSSLRSS